MAQMQGIAAVDFVGLVKRILIAMISHRLVAHLPCDVRGLRGDPLLNKGVMLDDAPIKIQSGFAVRSP